MDSKRRHQPKPVRNDRSSKKDRSNKKRNITKADGTPLHLEDIDTTQSGKQFLINTLECEILTFECQILS
jgi:hypothetical protein